MRPQEVDELTQEVWNSVFLMLDSHPDFTGDQAGEIAHHVAQEFRGRLSEWFHPLCRFDCAQALKLVADNPQALRPCDLDRLISTYWEQRADLLPWLKEQRPDLAARVDLAAQEIAEELAAA